jgi:hypothetical protein
MPDGIKLAVTSIIVPIIGTELDYFDYTAGATKFKARCSIIVNSAPIREAEEN